MTEELEKYLPPANSEEDQYRNYNQVLKDASRETAIKSAGIIASNPFRVIAIRQIASIAGGTNTDTNIKDVFLSGLAEQIESFQIKFCVLYSCPTSMLTRQP